MGLKEITPEKSSRRAGKAADRMASLVAALLRNESTPILTPEESSAAYSEALHLYGRMSRDNFAQVLRRLYREGEKEARERLRRAGGFRLGR